MLRFLLGGAGSGKTARIYDELCSKAGSGADITVLVPDQFVFETEKTVAGRTDEKAPDIKVTGLSSLAENILKKYAPRKTYADATAKYLIMMKAVSQLRGGLRYYGTASEKSTFVPLCLDIVSRFKSAGISAAAINERFLCGNAAADGGFAEKLSDIAMIMSLYENMLLEVYDDRQDNMVAAARIAAENDCFAGTEFYIDGFDGFSGSQSELIGQIVRQSENCTVALCIGENTEAPCFLPTLKTKAALCRIAESEFLQISEEVLSAAPRYKSRALLSLRTALENDGTADAGSCGGDIDLAFAPDENSEADYVCSRIKKYIRSGGRYSDIAVITPDAKKYVSVVKSAFLRYDIPLFADIPVPVSEKPLMKYIEYLLLAADDPSGENVMRYIKSGFVRVKDKNGGTRPVSMREINGLEEYARCWGLYGRKWTRPFAKAVSDSEKSAESTRAEVVGALQRLKSACEGKDGREITAAFTAFLFDEADIFAAIQGKCQDRTTSELLYEKALTEEYNYLWETLCGMFGAAYETLSGYYMTLKEYAAVINSAARRITMSEPPQVLDSVLFGDHTRTRAPQVKEVYIMGASSVSFPDYTSAKSPLFTDEELMLLSKGGLFPENDIKEENGEKRLSVYKALTLAENRLCITCCGKAEDICEAAQTVKAIFDDARLTDISKLTPLYFCESVSAAKKQLSVARRKDISAAAVIEAALEACGQEDYLKRAHRAEDSVSDDISHRHDAGETGTLLYDFARISPTAAQTLTSCRFAYFCRYGLNVRDPDSKTMNSINFGNTVHYILSLCFSKIYSDGGDGEKADIKALVNEAAEQYLSEFFLPREELSARFTAIYDSIIRMCVRMLTFMCEQVEKSRFRPMYFELSLKTPHLAENGMRIAPYIFTLPPLSDNDAPTEISLYGTVDRVDAATDENNGKWLRVIDYKTGSRDIDIGRIYYGLDLQLLIYLFALCENNPEYRPSAATYFPAGPEALHNGSDVSREIQRGIWLKNHEEKGFVLKDSQSDRERALYDCTLLNEKGVPKAANCFCGTVISDEAADKLKKRMEKVIGKEVRALSAGNADAEPIADSREYLSCKYCELAGICGRSEKHIRSVLCSEAREFEAQIKGAEE